MKLKIFFIAFLISLPFWWGVNILGKNVEDFVFWYEISKNPQVFTAQANQFEHVLKPIKEDGVENLQIEAKSAISVWINPRMDWQKTLFEKAEFKKLPIASLTKLMSVYIILEYYDLTQEVQISKKAADQPGIGAGKLKIGESFRVNDLLYPMLIESNNGAAYAISEVIGQEGFVQLLNLEAKKLGLENTYFLNPTGLDPEKIGDLINYSTTEDLVKLTNYLLKKPLIWEILSTPEFDLYSPDGVFHHKVLNTNEFLTSTSTEVWWREKIIGGKTGWTYEAGGCLLLIFKAPQDNGYLINVILGSDNRFEEMKKIINWVYRTYQ